MDLPPDTASRSGTEKPICVALVVCNDVIEDKRSGNKTLVGLFNGILTPQVPVFHPRMFLMASLTSGTGAWEFSFRILSPSGRDIFRMTETVRFVDPLIVHDVVLELRNLPLEETGVYFVDLLIGDAQVANRRFTVRIAQTPQ